jgi:phosphonate utilization transcriptional regulator
MRRMLRAGLDGSNVVSVGESSARLLQIVDNLQASPSNRKMPSKPSNAARGSAVRASAPAAVPADHPIALVTRTSLPSLVQREVERMILGGEIPAGGKLNEADLAAALGVSRGPVREAFRALEESGLVTLAKNRGVFVRTVSPDEADDIYELRAVLDEYAGRRLAPGATAAEVRALKELVQRMDKAVARADADAYHDANLAFHDRLVELAGNAKLLQLYRRLVNELRLYRRASLDQAGALPASVREHRAIVERIAAREAAAAGHLLYEHAMGGRERARRARDRTEPETRAPRTARRPR